MSAEIHIAPITRAEQSDAEALLRAQLAEHDIPLSAAGITRAVAEIFIRPERGAILLAKCGATSIGMAFLTYSWTPEIGGLNAWLEELYVLPAHRGHGVGTQLVQAALAHARAHGCAAVDLEVEHSHARAANLYSRLGFNELPRRTFRHDLRAEPEKVERAEK
jgi:ribosomal protein S18 acetylase RimI-like enzyme